MAGEPPLIQADTIDDTGRKICRTWKVPTCDRFPGDNFTYEFSIKEDDDLKADSLQFRSIRDTLAMRVHDVLSEILDEERKPYLKMRDGNQVSHDLVIKLVYDAADLEKFKQELIAPEVVGINGSSSEIECNTCKTPEEGKPTPPSPRSAIGSYALRPQNMAPSII